MARQKRQDIIDSLNITEQDLLGFLTKVSGAIEAFVDGEEGKFEPYNPSRVSAVRYHLDTAAMHLSHLFSEVPHVPRSHRAPEPVRYDEE